MLCKTKFKVLGTHCKSCKILIETELDLLEGVKDVNVDYQSGNSEVEFDNQKISESDIFKKIKELGYKIDDGIPEKRPLKKVIITVILIAVFVLGYFLVQKLGLFEILSRLNEERVSYGLIFFIGLLVSFHCIGMCGGLVIAYSAKKSSLSSHLQYNVARIISYTVIGGILGGLGSFFGINPIFTGIVTLLAGFFMVLMGLSLLTRLKWLSKLNIKTPSFIARFLYNQRHSKNPKAPFIIGLLNGFMPCGPLQAMQIYALASGGVVSGALSMGLYGLGTVPLMFGFGAFVTLISRDKIKYIMRISGAIVIVLGLFMLNRGLINFGYGFRSFTPYESTSQYLIGEDNYQIVEMELSYGGYSPNVIYIKKDVPVRWIINVVQMSGCTDEILLPEYDISKKLDYGENIIEFIPDRLGEIKFSCWMQMVWGKFIVVEDDTDKESLDVPQEGLCSASSSNCPIIE